MWNCHCKHLDKLQNRTVNSHSCVSVCVWGAFAQLWIDRKSAFQYRIQFLWSSACVWPLCNCQPTQPLNLNNHYLAIRHLAQSFDSSVPKYAKSNFYRTNESKATTTTTTGLNEPTRRLTRVAAASKHKTAQEEDEEEVEEEEGKQAAAGDSWDKQK